MAHPKGQREASRSKILASAGRGFRSQGFGGLGVDGLARAAGVTSGAFYAHFRSKLDAFCEAVAVGLDDLRQGIEEMRAEHGPAWIERFIAFYTTERRTCDLGESCVLQSLTADVARSSEQARALYEAELARVLAAMAEGLPGRDQDHAIAMLALLSGGVSMARAVHDPATAARIGAAVQRYALQLAKSPNPHSAPAA